MSNLKIFPAYEMTTNFGTQKVSIGNALNAPTGHQFTVNHECMHRDMKCAEQSMFSYVDTSDTCVLSAWM